MKRRRIAEDDDLGIPWDKLADGVPHRLKRNRDFPDIDPNIVREAAKNAAKRMDKAVQALPDRMGGRSKFIWVQFADYELRIGEPCKCGGRRILRFHPFFGRCASCKAQILLAPAKTDTNGGVESSDKDEDGWW